MIRLYRSECTITGTMAALVLAFATSALAETTLDPEIPAINDGNPTCAALVDYCGGISQLRQELEISSLTTQGTSTCNGNICSQQVTDPSLGVTFTVRWSLEASPPTDDPESIEWVRVEEISASSTQVQAVGIIGEGKSASHVFCPSGASFPLRGISAPGRIKGTDYDVLPTKMSVCWAALPVCLQTDDERQVSCAQHAKQFDPTTENNTHDVERSILQAHKLSADQPINLCSCGEGDVQSCDPTKLPEEGGCPQPTGNLSGQETQSVVTFENDCEVILMGTQYVYVGSGCYSQQNQ